MNDIKINRIFEKLKPISIILHGSQIFYQEINFRKDIDLIIISSYFRNIIFFDRIKILETLIKSQKLKFNIDAIGLTKLEFFKSLKEKSKLSYSLSRGYKILQGDLQLGKQI